MWIFLVVYHFWFLLNFLNPKFVSFAKFREFWGIISLTFLPSPLSSSAAGLQSHKYWIFCCFSTGPWAPAYVIFSWLCLCCSHGVNALSSVLKFTDLLSFPLLLTPSSELLTSLTVFLNSIISSFSGDFYFPAEVFCLYLFQENSWLFVEALLWRCFKILAR